MQMAAGRHARACDPGDVLADLHTLPDTHKQAASDDVPVRGLVADVPIIVNADVVAIPAVGAASTTVPLWAA